jgi:hypothetical protein
MSFWREFRTSLLNAASQPASIIKTYYYLAGGAAIGFRR